MGTEPHQAWGGLVQSGKPVTPSVEAGGSWSVQGQLEVHNEGLCPEINKGTTCFPPMIPWEPLEAAGSLSRRSPAQDASRGLCTQGRAGWDGHIAVSSEPHCLLP